MSAGDCTDNMMVLDSKVVYLHRRLSVLLCAKGESENMDLLESKSAMRNAKG
jgi:hypothetical protein